MENREQSEAEAGISVGNRCKGAFSVNRGHYKKYTKSQLISAVTVHSSFTKEAQDSPGSCPNADH